MTTTTETTATVLMCVFCKRMHANTDTLLISDTVPQNSYYPGDQYMCGNQDECVKAIAAWSPPPVRPVAPWTPRQGTPEAPWTPRKGTPEAPWTRGRAGRPIPVASISETPAETDKAPVKPRKSRKTA